jgi:hypothetical protein
MTPTFTRTLRLKVRPESYRWLNAAAVEVNGVFNFCNEASLLAATRTEAFGREAAAAALAYQSRCAALPGLGAF